MKHENLTQENDFFGKGKISRILLQIAPPVMLTPLPGYVEVFDLLFVGRHGRGRGGIYRDPRYAHPRLFAGRGRAGHRLPRIPHHREQLSACRRFSDDTGIFSGHRLWPHQSAFSLLRQIVCLLPLFWLLAQLGLDYNTWYAFPLTELISGGAGLALYHRAITAWPSQ